MIYLFLVLLVVGVLVALAVLIVPEHERVVVFRLGRMLGVRGPGLVVRVPGADRVERVSLRLVTFEVPLTAVLTRDNAEADVDGAAYVRVVDAEKAVVGAESHFLVAAQTVHAALREVVGQVSLDTLLHDPATVGVRTKSIVDQRIGEIGVDVERIDVKAVRLSDAARDALGRAPEVPSAVVPPAEPPPATSSWRPAEA